MTTCGIIDTSDVAFHKEMPSATAMAALSNCITPGNVSADGP